MERINIAEAADANYFVGLLVSTYSLARHASRDVELAFHILDGGIGDSSFKMLTCALANVHPHVTVVRHRIDGDSNFKALEQWHGSKMTYARLILPELLPTDDFVLYVDCDILWLGDVMEMWKLRDLAFPIMGVRDLRGVEIEEPWFVARGLSFSRETYFNAGNVLINLKLFRKVNLARRVLDVLLCHKDVQCADQSGLNAVLGQRVGMLPSKFNVLTKDIGNRPVKDCVVLHYAAQAPWLATSWLDLLVPVLAEWFSECALIPGLQEFPIYRTYSFMRRIGIVAVLPQMLRFRLFRWPIFYVLKFAGLKGSINSLRYVVAHSKERVLR